jgi:hypothetical protein
MLRAATFGVEPEGARGLEIALPLKGTIVDGLSTYLVHASFRTPGLAGRSSRRRPEVRLRSMARVLQ